MVSSLYALQSDLDVVHNVRVALGNGLRPDIWDEFRTRFNIPHIAEFFGATEGTAGTWNIFNRAGCVGRWSPLTVMYSDYQRLYSNDGALLKLDDND